MSIHKSKKHKGGRPTLGDKIKVMLSTRISPREATAIRELADTLKTSQSTIIETAVHNFKNLKTEEQEACIKRYLYEQFFSKSPGLAEFQNFIDEMENKK